MEGNLLLEVLRLSPKANLPIRAYGESAAWDLHAHLLNDAGRPFTVTLAPHSTRVVGTGLALRAPSGCLILICSRSGLATRSIFVANAPGVVDPDYTGEIRVALYNGGMEPHYVKHGDRIAQALVLPLCVCDILEVKSFPTTERGERGFGSSGD